MRRYPELDALRGLAALVIVLYHLRFSRSWPLAQTAVDLFFVLSGFLITRGLVIEAGRPGWMQTFYTRRVRRIWPAYFLAFGVVVAVNSWLPRPEPLADWWRFATFTPFVSRYWGVEPPVFSRLFYHAWTLAIEEQFYLAWPVVLLLFGRRGLAVVCVGLVIVPAYLRAEGLSPNLLLTRCEGLALGAALALWRGRGEAGLGPRASLVLGALGVAMLGVPAWRSAAMGTWTAIVGESPAPTVLASLQILRLNLLYLAMVGLAVEWSGAKGLAVLRGRWLSALGRISYGLYLYHPIVFALVTIGHRRAGLGGSVAWDVVKVGLSVIVAAASWRWVESPLLGRARLSRMAGPGGHPALPGPHVVTTAPALVSTARPAGG
jgi:peptidoglycan/LPS O-acetylase OafA/YrhL